MDGDSRGSAFRFITVGVYIFQLISIYLLMSICLSPSLRYVELCACVCTCTCVYVYLCVFEHELKI